MFTYNGRDAHRNLPAAKLHLPLKQPITDILPDRVKTEEDDVRDPPFISFSSLDPFKQLLGIPNPSDRRSFPLHSNFNFTPISSLRTRRYDDPLLNSSLTSRPTQHSNVSPRQVFEEHGQEHTPS